MRITLKDMSIKNFKGIKQQDIKFLDVTCIYGENGIGKTSIYDAFYFLLFDKDSKDRTKFDVQPLDQTGKHIHHLDTEVEATLEVDQEQVTLRKKYNEKWSKTRGKAETEFKGYETSHYVNDVPCKQNEYKKYINDLIDENTFKLITNPIYFASLNWKKRREILLDIIGDVDTDKIISYNNKLQALEGLLNDGIDNFMKSIKEKIRRLKKDREQIPARIDELNNSIEELNYKELKSNKKKLEYKINLLDEQIADKSKASEFLIDKKEQLFKLKIELQEKIQAAKMNAYKPKQELEDKINNIRNEIQKISMDIQFIEIEITNINLNIEKYNKQLDTLRKEYKSIVSRKLTIDKTEFICPICKRPLPDENISEQKQALEENFNSKKANDLKDNTTRGRSLTNKVRVLKENIEKNENIKIDYRNKINKLEDDLKVIEQNLSNFDTAFDTAKFSLPKDKDLEEKIKNLESEISNFTVEDTSLLKEEKNKLQIELRDIDKKLSTEEMNMKFRERIEELEEKEKDLSSKIALLEGQEILGEEFIRTKVELIEDTVNKKFKYVTFKLFNNLVNGGLEECCEPLVNGVPFTSNLNTAAKINAGIDIINTLSAHYKIQAPTFIDNRESVNTLIESQSQVINLIVSKDKKIRIEGLDKNE